MMSSYARYCQSQDCGLRAAGQISSPDIKAYHRRLGLQWFKLAEKARVAGGRTRDVTTTSRDAPAGTAAHCAISEDLPKSVAASTSPKSAAHATTWPSLRLYS